MSLLGRRSSPAAGAPSPRLVTKREGAAADAHRWAHETEGPSQAAQADAMGATVTAYLITGPALFGGLGWLLDRWLDITLFLPLGIVLGMGLSLYTIWLRYGTSQAPTPDRGDAALPGAEPQNEEIQ